MKINVNPVLRKELKTSVRSSRLAITILIYNAVLALAGLLTLFVIFSLSRESVDSASIVVMYCIITVMEFFMVIFVVPAYSAGSISAEREKQTLEILLTTTVSPVRIATGKLFSGISMMMLLVISSFPVLSLVFMVGGVSMGNMFVYLAVVLITAIYVGSIGIFFSSLIKRTTLSTVATYGVLAMIGAGIPVLLILIYYLMQSCYDKSYYAAGVGVYNAPNLGYSLLLLLLNPAVTLISLLTNQFGDPNSLRDALDNFGNIHHLIHDHWLILSLITQLGVSAILIKGAGRVLDPLRKKKNGGKRHKNKISKQK